MKENKSGAGKTKFMTAHFKKRRRVAEKKENKEYRCKWRERMSKGKKE